MSDSRDLVTTQPTGGLINFGAQDLDGTDFIPPRVKILQPMSKETEGDAKPGQWFNTLTGENYGETLTVIPIVPLKQRVFLVRMQGMARANTLLANADLAALSGQEGLQCRSLDMVRGTGDPGDELWFHGEKGCHECPLTQWSMDGQKRVPPPCTETYNVACVTDGGELVIPGMSKSGAKAGKKWFSMLRLRPGAPWLRQYELSTRGQVNDQGKFWTPEVRLLPEGTPTDLVRMAAYWFPQLTGRIIDVSATEDDLPDDAADLASPAF